ncbi:hypothetical protein FBU30_009714, partial [Linnemannia zychae]
QQQQQGTVPLTDDQQNHQQQPTNVSQAPHLQQLQTLHQQHQMLRQQAQAQQRANGLGNDPVWSGEISWMTGAVNGQPPREYVCSVSTFAGKKIEKTLEEE